MPAEGLTDNDHLSRATGGGFMKPSLTLARTSIVWESKRMQGVQAPVARLR